MKKEWDEAKYRYFLARKEYDKQREAYFKGTLKKEPPEPRADYSRSIKEYKKLLKEFPNYNRIDAVMFYLGRGLITAGKDKEGASYMLRLTKEYPKSQFKTKAYLAVAEYYFDNDLLFAAKSNYLKVLEDKKSTQYPYALYKLGYVYYNMRDYEDSIKAFKEVVKLFEARIVERSTSPIRLTQLSRCLSRKLMMAGEERVIISANRVVTNLRLVSWSGWLEFSKSKTKSSSRLRYTNTSFRRTKRVRRSPSTPKGLRQTIRIKTGRED